MFEKASRLKVRFPYTKGQVTVEDLWDLSTTVLDGIYKTLRATQKDQDGDSLLAERRTDTVLALQIDIVKYIVTVKVAEADAKKLATAKREQKARIMELIAEKQDESLKNKSIEELTALVGNL